MSADPSSSLAVDSPSATPPGIDANFLRGARFTWHQRRRHAAVGAMLAQVPPGELLDYGCGFGDLTWLASQRHQARGVDVDPQRVTFAASQYPEIKFATCRGEGLDFVDASFDAVLSVMVIHFVPDPITYLREICRVLRPGGHFVFGFRNAHLVRNALRKLARRGPVRTGNWVRPRGEVLQLLREEGFQVLDSRYFYNPPTEQLGTPSELLIGALEQSLSLLHVGTAAPYHIVLARKS